MPMMRRGKVLGSPESEEQLKQDPGTSPLPSKPPPLNADHPQQQHDSSKPNNDSGDEWSSNGTNRPATVGTNGAAMTGTNGAATMGTNATATNGVG